MVSATVIGAIVGVIIGIVLLIVLITCIIYISRKLKKKTNSRSKIISSNGVVIKDKWAEDEDVKKYFTEEENRMYFGHIDRTEHVEVKEKRRREEVIIPPEPQPLPPPPPPVVVPPPSPPRPQQPRLARYRIRSWTKRQRDPPPLKRRGSTGNGEGIKDFVYGIPYPVSSWSPIPAQPTQPTPAAPPPPPPQPLPSAPPVPNPAVECVQPEHKCQSIEEQERVLVIDDTMTERSFNTRYNSRVSAIVDNHVTAGVTQSMTNQVENCTREHLVPKIITDLV